MLDYTSYFDVIIREKFKQKAEIDEQMINQIKKRFEGLINLNDDNEENEERGNDIEDSKETLDILYEMSQILNCGLNKETLNILVTMIEKGVNPEALIRVVEELRKHNFQDNTGNNNEIFNISNKEGFNSKSNHK